MFTRRITSDVIVLLAAGRVGSPSIRGLSRAGALAVRMTLLVRLRAPPEASKIQGSQSQIVVCAVTGVAGGWFWRLDHDGIGTFGIVFNYGLQHLDVYDNLEVLASIFGHEDGPIISQEAGSRVVMVGSKAFIIDPCKRFPCWCLAAIWF